MAFEVAGKVAIITGAASGLGYCIAKTLLSEGLKGATIIDVNETNGQAVEKEFKTKFGENSCIFKKVDVSIEKDLEDAFEETIITFKQLDIVINNAAIISEQNWKKCLDINLGGCLLGTKLAIDKYLCKYRIGSEGIVINISSIAGLQPIGATPVYSITKQGIVAVGRTFGQQEHYKSTKVKVLTVCPGHMKTPMVMKFKLNKFVLKYIKRFNISLNDFPMQQPDFVAESLLDIMEQGKSGSVWVIEGGKPAYEVEFQDRFSMRKK